MTGREGQRVRGDRERGSEVTGREDQRWQGQRISGDRERGSVVTGREDQW